MSDERLNSVRTLLAAPGPCFFGRAMGDRIGGLAFVDALLTEPVLRLSEQFTGDRVPLSDIRRQPSRGWDSGSLRLRPAPGMSNRPRRRFLLRHGRAAPFRCRVRHPMPPREVRTSQGGYLAGPSPRGLDRFAVTVIDGDVVVDVAAFQYGPDR